MEAKEGMTTITVTPQDAATPDEAKAFVAMLKRVNTDKPKAADMEALQQLFDNDARLWRVVGDVAAHATEATIKAAYSGSALHRESIQRKIKELKEELGAGEASPLERMLIDHASLFWLRLHVTEATYTHRLLASDSHSHDSGVYWEKRLTGAQRRFNRALESLARVRALAAATRLIESRAEVARAAKRVNNLHAMKALAT